MEYSIGQILKIEGVTYEVIGKIKYKNLYDNCCWFEYKIKEKFNLNINNCWLSIDDYYREYSISWERNKSDINFTNYKEVDRGTLEVVQAFGDVDVSVGDRASFNEYEDSTEEQIISIEEWNNINSSEYTKEFSSGYYLDKEEIVLASNSYQNKDKSLTSNLNNSINKNKKSHPVLFIVISLLIVTFLGFMINKCLFGKPIYKFLKRDSNFSYVTSITGNEGEKADVYKSRLTIDDTVEIIISKLDGKILDVEENSDIKNKSVTILTDDEYCMVYESVSNEVLVQISSRKFAYTSDKTPYHSSTSTHHYYRNYYYSAAYLHDKNRYRRYNSPYENFSGEKINTNHFDRYDSYSEDLRRQSVNSRESSGGGVSSGK